MRRGRRKWKRKPSAFYNIVAALGGVRKASLALGFDASYGSLLAQGQRRVTPNVLERLAAIGQSAERP